MRELRLRGGRQFLYVDTVTQGPELGAFPDLSGSKAQAFNHFALPSPGIMNGSNDLVCRPSSAHMKHKTFNKCLNHLPSLGLNFLFSRMSLIIICGKEQVLHKL